MMDIIATELCFKDHLELFKTLKDAGVDIFMIIGDSYFILNLDYALATTQQRAMI